MFDRPSRLPLRRTRQQKSNRPNLARTWRIIATVTLIALASVYVAFAAISLSTSIPYSQNFTSMGIPLSNPAPSNLPADFRQDTIAAVRTLGSFSSSNTQTARVGGANVSTTAANGSYNFGAGTTTLGDADRAPGFISSGTATMSGNLYAQFVNNTGSALSTSRSIATVRTPQDFVTSSSTRSTATHGPTLDQISSLPSRLTQTTVVSQQLPARLSRSRTRRSTFQ
jgi:hypothetical protein